MNTFNDTVLQQVWRAQIDNANLNEAQKEKINATLDDLAKAIADYDKESAHIRSNGDLSHRGQESALASLGATSMERVQKIIDTDVKQLEERLLDLEYKLRPQKPDTDPVVDHLQQREIRDLLREKSELEIISLYQSLAVDGQDDLTMRAIEESPAIFPLISDKTILEAGKRGRAERHSPDNALMLKQLRGWRNTLVSAKNSALAHVGITDDSFLKKAAGQ